MTQTILEVNFKYNTSTKNYRQVMQQAARAVAKQRHLQSVIWLLDEQAHEAGGIFTFDDSDAALAYMQKPLAFLQTDARFSDIKTKVFKATGEAANRAASQTQVIAEAINPIKAA